ncbi:hypothetical protein [Actinoallomurus sp. CA-142502]|uniref:hypothetical protein n=1 Tax=Actinoallomurus sp. CA-142502 TaxID=3239885 RepID=UPI003D89DE2D
MLRVCVAAGALLLAAGCGGHGVAASPVKTVTATPKVTIDEQATEMCHKLAEARTLEANAKYAQVNDVRALTMRIQAQTLALKTAVPDVHQIATDPAATAGPSVPRLESWCTANGFRL